MRREYHINMYGVNTAGKVTSEKTIRAQHTMDKHQMVKWTNSWRVDGHITLPPPEKQTPEIKKIVHQLDSFVVKKTDGTGGPSWKYGAEGTQHDDGIMSLLGNLYIVKEKFLKISGYDQRTIGAKPIQGNNLNEPLRETPEAVALGGRTLGSVNTNSFYDNL